MAIENVDQNPGERRGDDGEVRQVSPAIRPTSVTMMSRPVSRVDEASVRKRMSPPSPKMTKPTTMPYLSTISPTTAPTSAYMISTFGSSASSRVSMVRAVVGWKAMTAPRAVASTKAAEDCSI